ncbi:MAG: hypothetical protein UT66_C0028G0030 [candidate division CPR2 bacterium GW2011_GWC1_39_9]|uniref:Uncharacterized protein n=1 Tax=candidate division CPR2 bacterium GW2011_GWC2_39_10 TaxID=1618345 RepID=A0A0G0M369_UNCC2|nr:MAG: hypothetical protein UT18_C0007G0056 [candidate division CPR2 bacterium GW2011_GWC2_39_10]KKR34139.1 MAG: hypothetical protein UT66_C0028G0030 [candidate division CPR2 bacterium GW2011_GWC1_39_9]
MEYTLRPTKLPVVLNESLNALIDYDTLHLKMQTWEEYESQIFYENPYYLHFLYESIDKYCKDTEFALQLPIQTYLRFVGVFVYRLLKSQCEINVLNDQLMGINSLLAKNLPQISKHIYELVLKIQDPKKKFEAVEFADYKILQFISRLTIAVSKKESKKIKEDNLEFLTRAIKEYSTLAYYMLYAQCVENENYL